jgi:hypothetical protein
VPSSKASSAGTVTDQTPLFLLCPDIGTGGSGPERLPRHYSLLGPAVL